LLASIEAFSQSKLDPTHWWLFYKHILKSYIIFWYSFFLYNIHCVHKNALARRMPVHTRPLTHTHTCKGTHLLALTHIQDHLLTHSNTLINIMHMYSFTLQQRLSSHHFLCFPFFLIVYTVNWIFLSLSRVFPVCNHYSQFFRGTAIYNLKSSLSDSIDISYFCMCRSASGTHTWVAVWMCTMYKICFVLSDRQTGRELNINANTDCIDECMKHAVKCQNVSSKSKKFVQPMRLTGLRDHGTHFEQKI